MSLMDQLAGIDPSVPDALFRRLLYEEELGYLREGNTITGFELDLDASVDIHGYTLIAIQKHTILAFRSELDEPNRLILFPSMDKLDDHSFGLQSLTVKRKTFENDQFESPVEKAGLLKTVAADLIPPYKAVEVDDDMAHSMRASIKEASFGKRKTKERVNEPVKPNRETKTTNEVKYKSFPSEILEDAPIDDMDEYPGAFEEAPIEHPDDFGDAPIDPPDEFYEGPVSYSDGFDEAPIEPPEDDTPFGADDDTPEPVEEPVEESKEDTRAAALMRQQFTQLHEVSDYVTVHLNLSKDIASTFLRAALNATPNREQQIAVAVQLFVKAFNNQQL